MVKHDKPPDPVHVPGITKGEEHLLEHGHEPGRGCRRSTKGKRNEKDFDWRDRKHISGR